MNLVPNRSSNKATFFPELPIQISEVPGFATSTLQFIREDKLPFGFGTKWRKAIGIIQFLKENHIPRVLLWGAIHGNYLASFTTIFRRSGFLVDVVAYTRDPNLHSYNERLVRGHSHTLVCYTNRKSAYEVWLEKEKKYSGLALPEFGIHPGQKYGLISFWMELEKKIKDSLNSFSFFPTSFDFNSHKAIIRMEIGSGATFLSAFDYFYESPILVQGVMVGETKETWIQKTEDLQKQLGLKTVPIPNELILEIPKETNPSQIQMHLGNTKSKNQSKVSYGKQTKSQRQWIYDFYRNTNILLEPIYSGMTVKPLLRELNEMQITTMSKPLPTPSESLPSHKNPNISREPVPIFYLHQGGQIQHLDLILEKDQK